MIFDYKNFCNCEICEDLSEIKSADVQIYIVYAQNSTDSAERGDIIVSTQKNYVETLKCSAVIVCLSGVAPHGAQSQIEQTLHTNEKHAPVLRAAIERALNVQYSGASPYLKSECAYGLLCALAATFDEQKETTTSHLVQEAVNEIHKNYSGIYGVEELSDFIGVSKHHLVREFSREMGTSPGKYLTQVRIDAAKQLLINRDYPLEIVAAMCGFSGSNYFCKVFKKHVGLSPTDYRQSTSDERSLSSETNELEQALFV